MAIVRLRQGSKEWHAWRRLGLGGSDAPAVLGVSPWKTARVLWEELTGKREPEQSDFAMRRGLRLEPVARALYEERTGNAVAPTCVVHSRLSWLRASLDGLDLWGKLAVEIKAPNVEAHQQALAGSVPDYYVPQVQHQLAAGEIANLDYVSYSEHRLFGPQEQLAIVPVVPDREYTQRLLFLEACFWQAVLLDYWPASWERPGLGHRESA